MCYFVVLVCNQTEVEIYYLQVVNRMICTCANVHSLPILGHLASLEAEEECLDHAVQGSERNLVL